MVDWTVASVEKDTVCGFAGWEMRRREHLISQYRLYSWKRHMECGRQFLSILSSSSIHSEVKYILFVLGFCCSRPKKAFNRLQMHIHCESIIQQDNQHKIYLMCREWFWLSSKHRRHSQPWMNFQPTATFFAYRHFYHIFPVLPRFPLTHCLLHPFAI